MTDIAEMTPVKTGKGKAGTDAATAKGAALAVVCVAFATKLMEEEEKRGAKLKMIVKSINDLDHKGHVEFRAELTKELALLRELRDTVGVTRAQMSGYSYNSFEVLVSNWKTVSTACELGYKPLDKAWGVVVAECVAMKNAHAADAAHGGQLPIKRKAGRKATPLIDKAIKAAEALLDNPAEFVKFAAWVETTLKAIPKTDTPKN